MKYIKLSEEEKQILEDLEKGNFKSVKKIELEKKRFQKYTETSLNKTKNINIRIPEKDLMKLKARALEKGVPYQTLLSSMVHQYANDKIKMSL
ncbi:hypothetical protein KAI92_02575 [Candidatus Parcubacteria bacterium]|nr:hypothetical protein [Candidatus Parcubacteria bacterium]